jgi:beta-galactosidase
VLTSDGEQIGEGNFGINLKPLMAKDVKIKLPSLKESNEYTLQVYAYTTQSTDVLPAGYEIAKEQFIKENNWFDNNIRRSGGALEVRDSADQIIFASGNIHGVINKKSAMLTDYAIGGEKPIKSYPEPYFWRAPNDNDFGNMMPQRCNIWRALQTNRQVKGCSVGGRTEDGMTVDFDILLQDIGQEYKLSYQLLNDGSVRITASMDTRGRKNLPEMPRFGMRMTLNQGYEDVDYYGRGPIENYSDRNTNTFIGRYHSTATDLFYPYIRPQQNGNRSDVRYFNISSKTKGVTLGVIGCQPLDYSALHYSSEDLDPGLTRKMQHTIDVIPRRDVYVIIDDCQRGLGGDNSWGQFPHNQYRHFADTYSLSYILKLHN